MDGITWPPPKKGRDFRRPSTTDEPSDEARQDSSFPGMQPEAAVSGGPATVTPPDTSQHPSTEAQAPTDHLLAKHASPPSSKRKRPYFKRIHLSRKQWLLVVGVVLILLVAGVAGGRALYQRFRTFSQAGHSSAKATAKPKPPKPTTEPSRLTGVEIPIELNLRPVTGIMIENSADARPQSGLKDAGIVYEAIAEGGITRFLALFQSEQPDYIGPVRSIRPYYLDFLMPFDAGVAHVGGAPQALSDIKSLGVRDLDQFANSGSFWRITQRYAPHNVYTSFAKLDELNAKKGFTSSTFTSFPRKKEAASAAPTARSINLAISSALFNAHYDYDAPSNSYKRSEGGAAHTDERSGAMLSPKVVIALVINRGIAGDGQHTDYATTGSGHVFVFQDGIVTEGTWSKADRKAQFVFTDAAGKPLTLNPGQTWISLVDTAAKVTFTP